MIVIVNNIADIGNERNCGVQAAQVLLVIFKLFKVLTLDNIECRFIIMLCQPYSSNLFWHVITHYDYTQSSFWFQYISTIDCDIFFILSCMHILNWETNVRELKR